VLRFFCFVQALLQDRHEIDHFRRWSRLRFRFFFDLFPTGFNLFLDHFHQGFAVIIAIFFRVPFRRHAVDERFCHIELTLSDFELLWDMELVCVRQFLSEMHQFQDEDTILRFHSGEILARFDGNLGDSYLTGLRQRLAQQDISFVAPFLWLQIVGLIEEYRIDFLLIDEILDVYGLSCLEIDALKIFILQNNVFSFFVFVAFDDVIPRYFLAVLLCYALVIDRAQILRAQKPKFQFFSAGGGVEGNRNID